MALFRRRTLVVAAVVLGLSSVSPFEQAAAEHEVTAKEPARHFQPDVEGGRSWNGRRVYLSSPRHTASGASGRECRNPGWEENINGRFWNYHAANSNYYDGQYAPSHRYRSLRSRGYRVAVSSNERLPGREGAKRNRDESNKWGANVHLPTHTNGVSGCPEPYQYLLEYYRDGDAHSFDFAGRLLEKLTPVMVRPNDTRRWAATLIELGADAEYRSYTELLFHTNQASQTWFAANVGMMPKMHAWRYGWAIDDKFRHGR